jgi:hypothetical protein
MLPSTAKIHRAKTARWRRSGCATCTLSHLLKIHSLFLGCSTKLNLFLVEVRRP